MMLLFVVVAVVGWIFQQREREGGREICKKSESSSEETYLTFHTHKEKKKFRTVYNNPQKS